MYDLRTVVFRHSSVYGGRQFATLDQGRIGCFGRKALEATLPGPKPFTINGTGKLVRDVLYVDDAVSAYRSAVAHIGASVGVSTTLGAG